LTRQAANPTKKIFPFRTTSRPAVSGSGIPRANWMNS
jgi:hypothetical protein